MRVLNSLLILFTTIIFYNCGSNIAEKGRQAYNDGDYNQAIQLLTAAKNEKNLDNDVDEMIVLSYMYRGKELYDKTQNLKSFSGNYISALKHLPKSPTADFRSKYNDLLIELARAYKDTKPKTESEHEENFRKSINIIDQVLKEDSTKAEAKTLFSEIEVLIFKKYLDKANTLYTKAKKTDDWDLFFNAESYLQDAEKLNPNSNDVKALRQKIRRETLGVLNYRDGVSLAVTERMYEKGKMIMFLVVKNYKNKPLQFDPTEIELVDLKGNVYNIDKEEMRVRELFGQIPIKAKTLNGNEPLTEGLIAFDAPKDLAISYLALNVNGEQITRKYFR